MAKNEVKIVITGDASKLQAASKQAEGALAKLAGGVKAKSSILDGALGVVRKAAKVTGGAVAAITAKSLWGGFQRLKGLEEAGKRLESMGVNAKQSKKLMDALNDTLTGTPYALDAGAKAMSGFVSASTPLEKIPRIMNSVTDAAAFGQAPLEEIATIFQKVQTNGKASTRMLQELQLRGVPASNLLASALNLTGEKFNKFVADGKLAAEVFFDAWEKGAQGFGDDNIKMAGAAQSAGDTVAGSWGNLMTSLSRAGAKVLEPLFDRLPGWFQAASTAISDFTRTGLDVWLDRVRNGVGRALDVGRRLIDWFKENQEWANAAAVAVATVAGAITGLLVAYKAVQALQSTAGALKELGTMLAEHPVILIVAAIAALAAGLVVAYKKVGWFHDAVDAVGRWLKKTFQPVLENIGGFLKDTWPKVVRTASDVWTNTLRPALEKVGSWIANTLWPILQKVIDWIVTNLVEGIKGWARVFTDVLWPALQTVASWIQNTLWPTLKSVAEWIAATLTPVIELLAAIFKNILWPALRLVADIFKNVLWPILKTVGSLLATVLTPVVKALGWVWSNVLWPALKTVATFIVGTVIPVIARIVTTFVTVASQIGIKITEIVGFVLGIPRRIGSTIATLWNGLTSGITTARNVVSNMVNSIVSVVTGIGRRIVTVATAITSPFRSAFDGIRSLWNQTVGGFGFDVPSWVPGVGGKGFRIPKMHTGGIVPGPRGAEVLTVLQAGELVIPADLTTGLSTPTAASDSFTAAYQPTTGGPTVVVKIDLSGALMTPDMPGKIVELVEAGVAAGHQTPRLARSLER